MDVIAVTLGVWLVSWEKLSEPEKFLMTWNTYRLMSIETTSSLTPDPPDLGAPEGIKIGHVLAYTWLMLWFAQIYRPTSTRLCLSATFIALGIALEYLQGLTDYRGFEYSDILINSVGVALGLLLGRSALQNGLATIETVLLERVFRNP